MRIEETRSGDDRFIAEVEHAAKQLSMAERGLSSRRLKTILDEVKQSFRPSEAERDRPPRPERRV